MPELSLTSTAPPCPACQRPTRVHAAFCANCGVALAGSVQPTKVDETHSTYDVFSSHWGTLRQIFWLFGLLLLSSLVEGWISRVNANPWVLTITSGIDAVMVCVFAAFHRNKISELIARPKIDQRCAAEVVGVAGVAFVLLNLYFSLVQSAGIPFLQISHIFVRYGWPTWSMFALVCLAPAIFEELAFRGVIQSCLESVLSSRDALLIQAALFSVLHLSPVIFASHFLMGLVLGYLRNRSRSLYPGMLFHASWNAMVLLAEIYRH